MYGAALYRLRLGDFEEIRHIDGISLAWPLIYDDFELWYTGAERLYQVHGNAGEDPTRGHGAGPHDSAPRGPQWHPPNGVKGKRPAHHPSRSPISRAWVTAWLRVEAPSLR
jgi:choline dehydrogenase-like flavoprotein